MLLTRATIAVLLVSALGARGSSESEPEAAPSSTGTPSASATASASTYLSARPEKDYAAILRAVHDELTTDRHTTTSRVQLSRTRGTVVMEFDTFALEDGKRRLSRRVTNLDPVEGEPDSFVLDIAMSGDHRFLQSPQWEGSVAAGCWLDLTDQPVGDSGLTASDFPLEPNAVAALTRIRVEGNELDDDGLLHAEMSARDAVPMLGVVGQALLDLQISVSTYVPVVLDFDGEYIHSLSIDGAEVVNELGAEIPDELAAYLGQLATYVEYAATPSTGSLAPPPPAQVMTDFDQGCRTPAT